MATTSRAVKLARNPRRPYRPRKNKGKGAHRRRLSLKQKLHFGTKRVRAAAKAALYRRRVRAAAPRRRVVVRPPRRRTVTRNPVHLITLGPINPTRRATVARPRRNRRRRTASGRFTSVRHTRRRRAAHNPRRYHRRRARHNATRVVVMAPARHRRRRSVGNPRRRVHYYRRRRNPGVFGQTGKGMATAIAGGLVGVTVTKLVPTMVPASLQSSTIMKVVVSGAVAVGAGMLARKFAGPTFGDGVMFGGLMQTASMALNAFIPSIGGRFSLGELMPGSFPVPQNPIRAGIVPAPAQARIQMSGLQRVYGHAF